jgi:lipopolysaccharide biosynthesis regulator YciM
MPPPENLFAHNPPLNQQELKLVKQVTSCSKVKAVQNAEVAISRVAKEKEKASLIESLKEADITIVNLNESLQHANETISQLKEEIQRLNKLLEDDIGLEASKYVNDKYLDLHSCREKIKLMGRQIRNAATTEHSLKAKLGKLLESDNSKVLKSIKGLFEDNPTEFQIEMLTKCISALRNGLLKADTVHADFLMANLDFLSLDKSSQDLVLSR